MAIIYDYPLAIPKASDTIIGTVTFDPNVANATRENPTRTFKISDIAAALPGTSYILSSVGQGNGAFLKLTDNTGAISGSVSFTTGTGISLAASTADVINIDNSGVTQVSSGSGILLSGQTGNVVVTNSGVTSIVTTDTGFINSTVSANSGAVSISSTFNAGGSPSNTTFLRGDNEWVTITNGTVTSVAAGTGGITVTGTANDPVINNTKPDQTVVIGGQNGIAVTGVYPNFLIDGSNVTGKVNKITSNTITITPAIGQGDVNIEKTDLVIVKVASGITPNILPKFGPTNGGAGNLQYVLEDSVMTENAAAGLFTGKYFEISGNGGLSTQNLKISGWLLDNNASKGTNGQVLTSTGTGLQWTGSASGVTGITAGTNVTISPVGGTGNVTINASGGGGGGTVTSVGTTTSNIAALTLSGTVTTSGDLDLAKTGGTTGQYIDGAAGAWTTLPATGVLTVTSADANVITIGGTTINPTVNAKTAAPTAAGTNLATGDNIVTYVTNNINDKIRNITNPTLAQDVATKNYVDTSIVGGLIYQGGYDAATNAPILDSRGTQIAVDKGWTYTVTVDGTFYGEIVKVGDVLIAETSLATGVGALTDWTTVQSNIDIATATIQGIANFPTAGGLEVLSGAVTLPDTGIVAGTFYTPAAVVVDAKGRISSITENLTPPGIGGTTGKIPKFTASNTIGNSIMTETASLITTAGSIKPTTITDTNSGVGTAGQVLSSTGSALDWIDSASSINTILVTVVAVGASKYYFIDGAQQQSLELVAGVTYRLDQSATTPSPGNSGHRLKFSTTSDGTWNSGVEYTTGVTYSSATPGSAGAYTQIILEQDTPKLYYYCQYHSGMGGEVIDPRAGGLFTSFTATDGTFINLTPNTTQTGVVTLSADLSAGTPGSPSADYFLRGDNTWATVPAAYTLNLTGNSGGPVVVPTGSTIDIKAAAGLNTVISSSGTNRIATISPDYTTSANIILSAPTTLTVPVDQDSIMVSDFSDANVKDMSLSILKTYVGGVNTSIAKDEFTGDGSQKSFALSTVPFSTTFTDVYISGVYQQKSTYSLINGNQNIYFDPAPPVASIEVMTVVTSNVIPGANTLVSQQFNGDGTQTSFVLSNTPSNINFTNVYINGVYQEKTVYTVTGTTLTFTGGTPQTGDLIEVMIMTAVSLVQITASNYSVSTISANTTAVKNTLYVFTANLTLTLPISPATGDSIKISNLSAVATCVLARNGSLIMGVATDLTLNNAVASFELIYSGATKGWVIIGPQ